MELVQRNLKDQHDEELEDHEGPHISFKNT